MIRLASFRCFSTALLALGVSAVLTAQTAPEVRKANEKEKEKAAVGVAPKRRALSPEVAAQLSAATPKFGENPKIEPRLVSEENTADARETDKPRNGIIRLDPMIVQEQRSPVFRERTITTDKGLADIAVKRYISETDRAMNRFTLPLFGKSQEDRAIAMYEEDERLKNMSDLHSDAVAAAKSDRNAGEQIRREAQQTYMRTPDFGYSGKK